jgi:hypothetical protein
MNKTFTTTDLILFAFNETVLADTVFIVKALEDDPYLQAEFREVIDTIGYIDTFRIGPSDASLNGILSYSRSKIAS